MATVYCAEDFQFLNDQADLITSLNQQLNTTNCTVTNNLVFQNNVDPYGVTRRIVLIESGAFFYAALDSAPSTACLSTQVYLDTLNGHNFALANDGATIQAYVAFAVTGAEHVMKAYRGDGLLLGTASDSVEMVGQWHQVSIKFTIAESGAVTGYIDGVLLLNLSGVDTRMTAANQLTKLGVQSNASYCRLCEYVVSDDHFANGVRVITKSPNADGDDAAWSRSAGAANWQALDDLPRSATDYIYSATVGAENSVKVAALSVSGSVRSVVDQIYARKSNADLRQITQFVKSGTKSYGSAITLGGTSAVYARKMDVNPVTSSPWAAADFGASGAQFGQKVEA